MYIEASYPSMGDNARLESPKLQFSGAMCLSFYYHMYGSSMGTLNVIINGVTLFTASGDKGNTWLRKDVNVINLSGMYAVRKFFMDLWKNRHRLNSVVNYYYFFFHDLCAPT